MENDKRQPLAMRLAFALAALGFLFPVAEADAQPDPSNFSINHFNIYLNGQSHPPLLEEVTLTDQFATRVHILGSIARYGVPVDKNGEGIPDPLAHLTFWQFEDNNPQVFRTVVVRNQFGDYTLNVFSSRYLLAPSLKNNSQPIPLPDTHDHYKCYDVFGDAIPVDVQLQDQFEIGSGVSLSPTLLCNPAEKVLNSGETYPVNKPDEHLVCYTYEQVITPPRQVIAEDQFGLWPLTLVDRRGLCVPSLKDDFVQINEGTWGELKSIYR